VCIHTLGKLDILCPTVKHSSEIYWQFLKVNKNIGLFYSGHLSVFSKSKQSGDRMIFVTLKWVSMHPLSASALLTGCQEGHPARKKSCKAIPKGSLFGNSREPGLTWSDPAKTWFVKEKLKVSAAASAVVVV